MVVDFCDYSNMFAVKTFEGKTQNPEKLKLNEWHIFYFAKD